MGSRKISPAAILAAVVVVAVAVLGGFAEAQDTPSCAQKLVPCASYLNSTGTPPESCCKPMREAVATERECLCSLYNSPGFLDSLGITMTQALRLTVACSADADASLCKVNAPSPTATAVPPPGVPGNGNGAASMVEWTGKSTLLISIAFVMLY